MNPKLVNLELNIPGYPWEQWLPYMRQCMPHATDDETRWAWWFHYGVAAPRDEIRGVEGPW